MQALIVDDDRHVGLALAEWVRNEGFRVATAGSLAAARAEAEKVQPDLILLDLSLPDGSGLELLADGEAARQALVVVITAHATVETAVEALRLGAIDYLTKPADRARLSAVLANVARTRAYRTQIRELRGELRRLGRFGLLVGASPAMRAVYELIERVAPTDATVLVTGESGTGKELAARTLHALSRRADQPFVALNAAAISSQLTESELFGHERGSFTGADRARAGYFEAASGGTLFLDEITEMPAELQTRLLRVLETGSVTRVGSTRETPVDVRIVAATNRDPEEAVAEERLREDLLYRLNVFPIHMPALRERGEDVALLAEHFLTVCNEREGSAKRFAPGALEALGARRWPGNVRELENAVRRAFILADGEIGLDLMPARGAPARGAASLEVRVGTPLDEIERRVVLATLQACGGNRQRTAEQLGISPKTLYNRLKQYEVS